MNVNWLERGQVAGFEGNTHRGYATGGISTEGTETSQYMSGMVEHFNCPKGVTPPLFYAWAEPRPATLCTYLGVTDMNLDGVKVSLKRDLSSATVAGTAVMSDEDGQVVSRLAINLKVTGVGRTSVTIDTYEDEGHTDVLRQESRHAKVTGRLGGMRIGDESSDRSGGSLDFNSTTHQR